MADTKDLQQESVSELFDGNTIAPQFAIALRNFINATLPLASGRATGSGNPTIAGGYTAVKIALVAGYANGITFDGTNHRFVCTIAGNYLVAASAGYVNTVAAEEIDVLIYKNGSGYSYGFGYTPGGLQTNSEVTDIVQLAVGDYIELYTAHSGSSRNLTGGVSFLSIAKI